MALFLYSHAGLFVLKQRKCECVGATRHKLCSHVVCDIMGIEVSNFNHPRQIFAALLAKDAMRPAWLVLIEATPAPTATTSVKSWAFWVWRCCANSSVDEAAAAAPCWALLVQQLATVGTKPGKYPDSRSFLHPQSWTRELPFESRTVPQFLEHRF